MQIKKTKTNTVPNQQGVQPTVPAILPKKNGRLANTGKSKTDSNFGTTNPSRIRTHYQFPLPSGALIIASRGIRCCCEERTSCTYESIITRASGFGNLAAGAAILCLSALNWIDAVGAIASRGEGHNPTLFFPKPTKNLQLVAGHAYKAILELLRECNESNPSGLKNHTDSNFLRAFCGKKPLAQCRMHPDFSGYKKGTTKTKKCKGVN